MTPTKPPTLAKSYEPKEFETKHYEFWEKNDCFSASDTNEPGQKSFCIVIPPPNVTGVLHMGHALTNTIQDILTRWRRMHGDNALWLPGTDHAGIATQAQVEKQIAKESKTNGKPTTRHDLGRQKFLERTWKWKEDHHHIITSQLKRLGSSLDWKRERFTLDEGCSNAVTEVFVRLYEQGLMYRGDRIINWCTRCQTALSDLEVIPTDRKSKLWHIKYQVDGTKDFITVATTRPETMLGDSALAVHPEDERYLKFHGKKVRLPLLGRLIPIIADSYVDKEFGSGALKVTPAHDFNDYELGVKHKLEFITVMGKEGRITEAGGIYKGLKFDEAREKVIADLTDAQLLGPIEEISNKVGLCQRCDRVAEPLISKQWFVKTAPLAKKAIDVVESGQITFTPKNWEKTYFEWMYNIRDWCVSRQLWWGHQIPAWYCNQCSHTIVAKVAPAQCSKCQSADLTRDEDVLDTWFSSALWPFATLGWPEKTKDLKTFYPTSVLETGFDIIFFWVSRMIMMGVHFMDGQVPFSKVYLHAMVRDEKGEKMSKSKGNVIDPLDLIKDQGADPLRFTLASMAGQGRDIKLSVDRVTGNRAFCNKLWNATKFLHLQFDNPIGTEAPENLEKWLEQNFSKLSEVNQWIISRLQLTIETVETSLQKFELDVASRALYDFAWHECCDWYIEFSKSSLKESGESRLHTIYTLHYVLEQTFKLLHPFIPFVTEELWQSLPWKTPSNTPARVREGRPSLMTLMFHRYPLTNSNFKNEGAEKKIEALKRVVEALRNFRGENNISPKQEFAVQYVSASSATDLFIKQFEDLILSLAKITQISKVDSKVAVKKSDQEKLQSVIPLSSPSMEIIIQLEGLVDAEGEKKRLQKEISKVMDDISHIEKKLTNEAFVSRAPKELVDAEKSRVVELKSKLIELKGSFEKFTT